jgi:DNA topoisomerase-1
MGKKLVIVESPAKAKTINKILGDEYVVKSSMGHVRDLPVKTIGVDIKHGFKPKYVIVKGRTKTIDELKKTARTCDSVFLAPDPDREGEAIAWHLQAILKSVAKDIPFFRVQYNEITPGAVRKAFDNPGKIDTRRVDAQQARRILDRIVGYMVSPMLWRRMKRGLSAGRVQSVALRLVCEKERQIQEFVPVEYWLLGAVVRKLVAPLDPFKIRLVRINGKKAVIKTSEQAEAVKSDMEGQKFKVTKVSRREINKKPAPPHVTSTLQQAASNRYGFSPKRTMSVAQRLYEGMDIGGSPVGLITYMRTDSFTVSQDAVNACREFVRTQFGNDYCPDKPNFYKNRASAQEAHEAIRPTDLNRTPKQLADKLDPAQLKIYSIIWERFVASQMSPAKIGQRIVDIETTPPPEASSTYLFHASTSEVKFPGYMKVSSFDNKPQKEEETDHLPELTEGEPLERLDWLTERKETQPPQRYSEASLVRALETNGVGRPSTYAQIISTLYQRKYVTRDKRVMTPLELGMKVNDLLVSTLGELFDVKFTASMEESLDRIETGSIEWTNMLADFYANFEKWMLNAQEPAAEEHVVASILDQIEKVTQWAPETRKGKRKYNDRLFVESIRSQLTDKKKPVSQRQLITLVKIACHYKDQVPEIEAAVSEAGFGELLTAAENNPPRETTVRKLEILKDIGLEESALRFAESLRSRVVGGRALTEPQVKALNNIVLAHSSQIADFEKIKDELDVSSSAIAEDNESGPLIDALACVTKWNEPVTRGRRVFDDSAFYASLLSHFSRKGFLTPKQRAALKRMAKKYRDQIHDYEKLEAELGLAKSKQRDSGNGDATDA